jgi:hypothetical protein
MHKTNEIDESNEPGSGGAANGRWVVPKRDLKD